MSAVELLGDGPGSHHAYQSGLRCGRRLPSSRKTHSPFVFSSLTVVVPKRACALVVTGLAVALALTWRLGWWTGSRPPATESGALPTTGSSSSSGSAGDASTGLTLFPLGSRPTVPALQGVMLDDKAFDLASLRGHVVVLNAWATWCGPCRAESPGLARASKATYSQGVRFVGIDTRDQVSAALAFRRAFGITYPSVVDTDGRLMLAFARVIPISGIPSTLIVDPSGHITARVIGPVDYTTLRGLISDVLSEASDRPTPSRAGRR